MTQAKPRENRLYRDLAWTFPIVTPLKHYREETDQVWKLIVGHSKIIPKTLLHLGCGAGHTDFYLKKRVSLTGIDISLSMLKLARKLNPEATYIRGDMRFLKLKSTFDAVVAWDSIPYMTSTKDLGAVFKSALFHLRPGGIFLFFLEETKENFGHNKTTLFTGRKDDVEITFIENRFDPDPLDSSYESTFIYLIRKKGKLTIEVDRHRCGLFRKREILNLLQQTGFQTHYIEFVPSPSALEGQALAGYESFPLFIASKRTSKGRI